MSVYAQILSNIGTKYAEDRALAPGVDVILFVNVDEQPVQCATACLQGTTLLRRTLHGTNLQSNAKKDMVVIRFRTIKNNCESLSFPYVMPGVEEGPATLRNVSTAEFYAWDSRMMISLRATMDGEILGSHDNTEDLVIDPAVSEDAGLDKERQSDVDVFRVSAADADDVKIVSTNVADIDDKSGTAVSIRKFSRENYDSLEIYARLSQIMDVSHPLRPVNQSHRNKLIESFRTHGYDYSKGLLTVTLRGENYCAGSDVNALFTNQLTSTSRFLKADVQVSLVDGRHRFATLKELAAASEQHELEKNGLRVILLKSQGDAPMSAREIVLYSRSCNILSGLVLSDTSFIDNLRTLLTFAKTFEMDYGVRFVDARTKDIADDLKAANFLSGASHSSCMRHVRVAKFMVRCPTCLQYVEKCLPETFGITHFDDWRLRSSIDADAVLLIQAAESYLLNPARPKGEFPVRPFYAAAKRYLNALHTVYAEVACSNGSKIQLGSFSEFLKCEVPHNKATTMTVQDMFLSCLKLFQFNTGIQKKRYEIASDIRRKRSIVRIRNTFLKKVPINDASTPSRKVLIDPNTKSIASPRPALASRVRARPITTEDSEVLPAQKRFSRPQRTKTQTNYILEGDNMDTVQPSRTVAATLSQQPQSRSRFDVDNTHLFDDTVLSALPSSVTPIELPSSPLDLPVGYVFACRLPPGFPCDQWKRGETKSVHDLLQALYVPLKHRSHLFFTVEDVVFIRDRAWLRATLFGAQDAGLLEGKSDEEAWAYAGTLFNSGFGQAYFVKHSALIRGEGFTIMERFATHEFETTDYYDKYVCNLDPQEAFIATPDTMETSTFAAMHATVYNTFGPDVLRSPARRKYWTPIINRGSSDNRENSSGASRFTSTRRLLMHLFERSTDLVWVAKRRAVLDVWLCCIASLLNLYEGKNSKMRIPATGGRFLITGADCKAQLGHNDMIVRRGASPGYFFIANGPEEGKLYVCKGSHHFVFYPPTEKRKMADILKMDPVVLPPYCVFVGHGYLTHAGSEFIGHNMRYHLYLFPSDVPLHDAIVFAFNWSVEVAKDGEGNRFVQNTEEDDEGEKRLPLM